MNLIVSGRRQHMTSLIETMLWVGLIIWVILRFDKPLKEILTAIHKRVESGSTVKAGLFELTDQIRPLKPEKQAEKANEEINELLAEDIKLSSQPSEQKSLRANYYTAEDLAIRAIESEFNQSVNRNISFGRDIGFDAAFSLNGQLQIIEVKYFTKQIDYQRVKKSIAQISSSHKGRGWKNVRIIFALVAEEEAYSKIRQEKLKEISSDLEVEVLYRCYTLSSLQEKFGV